MTVKNGCASKVPFLITRSRPPCSATNTRPSGANAIAVGALRPLTTSVSANPEGKVAAPAADTTARHASAAAPVRAPGSDVQDALNPPLWPSPPEGP
jgi:hypothetical protein